jgi:hypothetical protein
MVQSFHVFRLQPGLVELTTSAPVEVLVFGARVG